MRTPVVPVKFQKSIQSRCRGSAGPNPSISGMKKMYWGKDAHVLKCGSCIYLVDSETYNFYASRF